MMSKEIIVETSARHVHLTREALDILFGEGYELTNIKNLLQPGEFASNERITIVGPKSELKNVLILGPLRPVCQVELSMSDARSIGVKAPIRLSGDVAGSAGCTLVGPNGSIELQEGVIVAKRHIHITPEDASTYNVTDNEIVSVQIDNNGRSITFGDVMCRVSEKFATALHIDTDESNAAGGMPSVGNILK